MSCLELSCASSSTGAVNQYMTLLFSYLTASQCSLSNPEMWPKDYGYIALEKGFEEYDFIIVGAGTAGCVVAGRLSENVDWKILLVEAGENPPIESAIPGIPGQLQRTKYDWGYNVEPSERHSLFSGNGSPLPRGKMLGGSGSLNGMLYIRGNPDDYNNWEALGNPTWNWDNVLEYFKKTEANQNPEIANAFDGYYHATDGPMFVELVANKNIPAFNITGAAEELGFRILNDINANEHIGFLFPQTTIRAGVRESTATAFLSTASGMFDNLHVVKQAHVHDLVIDADGVVTGVKMKLRGKDIKVFAKKEVILSAGAINSPQILMLSGIGPALHLEDMNIPVKLDLNVGKNLQDHPAILMVLKQKASDESEDPTSQQVEFLKNFFTYLTDHSGPLTSFVFPQPSGFVNVLDPLGKYPDIQYLFAEFHKGQVDVVSSFLKQFGYTEIAETIATEATDADLLLIFVQCLIEKSRGEILLRSFNPEDKPRIVPNFLDEQSDIEALTGGARLILRFLETSSLSEHNTEFFVIPIPECDSLIFDSDAYWNCYSRYMTCIFNHFVGTCKMGPDSDPEAVVDYRLRVMGTTGLRVIDASVMPVIVRGNTNAPTVMIAEKAADFIKDDWNFDIDEDDDK